MLQKAFMKSGSAADERESILGLLSDSLTLDISRIGRGLILCATGFSSVEGLGNGKSRAEPPRVFSR